MIMIEETIRIAIQNAAAEADIPVGGNDIKLEHPALAEHGDFATNFALTFAKKIRKPPMEIATSIARNISSPLIAKADAAAPGFINLWLSDAVLRNELKHVMTAGKRYGAPQKKNQRVLVEHTQINPNKEPHIGHLRNACIGDALMKLYHFAEYDAKALYYHNDVGQQIASILLAEKKAFIKPDGFQTTIAWASAAYADIEKRMEENESLKNDKEKIQLRIAEQNTPEAKRAETLTLQILHETLDVLAKLNVSYDLIVRESDILKGKLWEKTFELLKTKSAFYEATEGEKKDCWLIKMPDAEDKIIVRSNGVPTYAGNDIANHLWKFGVLPDFRYEKLDWKTQAGALYMTISEDGEARHDFTRRGRHRERHRPNANLSAGKRHGIAPCARFHERSGTLSSCELRLCLSFAKDGREIRHADRRRRDTGEDQRPERDDYLDRNVPQENGGCPPREIRRIRIHRGSPKRRHQIRAFEIQHLSGYCVRSGCRADIHGMSGPYVQYASTRAKSILAKAGAITEVKKTATDPLPENEKTILRMLYRFPEVVAETLHDFAPHYLCLYLFELSQLWNSFYNENRIIGSERETERLTLVRSIAQVLENGLGLLGIEAPKKM